MPVQVFGQEEIEKVLIANPDSRFATTYLSNTYRKYAVNGETIQDKATGEIFTKRPVDGRVVSFYQNKKYMYDLMLELKILTNSNPNFKFPDKSHPEAFYLSTDYDLMTVYDDAENNIMEKDNLFPTDSDIKKHNIVFKISSLSNGFFCRVTPRDADKVLINWLTEKYDTIIQSYVGNDPEYLEEKEKFLEIPEWDECNATINYTITFINPNGYSETFTYDNYVHISEEHSVMIPTDTVAKYYGMNGDVTIRINSLSYPKIHFMLKHMTDEMREEYPHLIYPDNKILIPYLNIMTFIDKSSDIIVNENEFIVAMVDVPYCINYMAKVASIIDNDPLKFILSPDRPSDDRWLEGGVWGEEVRNVYAGGMVVDKHSETVLAELERMISNLTPVVPDPFSGKVSPINYFVMDNEDVRVDEEGNMIILMNRNDFISDIKKTSTPTNMYVGDTIYINTNDSDVVDGTLIMNHNNTGIKKVANLKDHYNLVTVPED